MSTGLSGRHVSRLRSRDMTSTTFRLLSICGAFVGALAMFGASGPAAAATCPPSPSASDRVFEVTPSSSCVDFGSGNVDNDTDFNTWLASNGYVLLDKSDKSGVEEPGIEDGMLDLDPPTSGLSGDWAIVGPNVGLYDSFLLALKSGNGQADPDWGVFLLTALSGTWSIENFSQELSHGNLYGRLEEAAPIPLPAALPLFGAGLAGIAWMRRRGRKAAVA